VGFAGVKYSFVAAALKRACTACFCHEIKTHDASAYHRNFIPGNICCMVDYKSRIFFRISIRKQTHSIFQENCQTVLKETREAVKRYIDTVNRRGIFKRIYSLMTGPWFLICGGKGSGKKHSA
jgi:hypothetical protein